MQERRPGQNLRLRWVDGKPLRLERFQARVAVDLLATCAYSSSGRGRSNVCPLRTRISAGLFDFRAFIYERGTLGMADSTSANGAQPGTNKPPKQPPARTHAVSPSDHLVDPLPPPLSPIETLQSSQTRAPGRADKADTERPTVPTSGLYLKLRPYRAPRPPRKDSRSLT